MKGISNYMKTIINRASDYLFMIISDSKYRDILMTMTLDEPEFSRAPGSTKHHHVYTGGLLVHTAEVVYFASKLGSELEWRERYNLITAAVIHDAMKVRDYEQVMDKSGPYNIPVHPYIWTKTTYAEQIYHVTGSVIRFGQLCAVTGIPHDDPDFETICHNMLAHHGQLQWRSPVEPQTPAAYMLHAADMLSLKMGQTESVDQIPRMELWK